jgi:hypothetical protein
MSLTLNALRTFDPALARTLEASRKGKAPDARVEIEELRALDKSGLSAAQAKKLRVLLGTLARNPEATPNPTTIQPSVSVLQAHMESLSRPAWNVSVSPLPPTALVKAPVAKGVVFDAGANGHQRDICAMCQLADGRVVTGDDTGKLLLWDVTGNLAVELKGHTDEIVSISAAPDGRFESTSFDETARVWDAAGNEVAVLTGHSSVVTCSAWLNDGRIATGSKDETLKVWNEAGDCLNTFATNGTVESVVARGAAGLLLTDSEWKVHQWDGSSSSLTSRPTNQTPFCFALSGGDTIVANDEYGGPSFTLEHGSGHPATVYLGGSLPPEVVASFEDGTFATIARREVVHWQTGNTAALARYTLPFDALGQVIAVGDKLLVGDGRRAIVLGLDELVKVA